MKAIWKISMLAVLGAFAGSGLGNAQSTSPFCNDQLIRGVYGFTIEGTKLVGPGPTGPQVGVALTQFDGQGGLVQIDSVTIGGVQTANFTETPTQGTYSVSADCTGTFTLNFTDGRPTITTYFVVVENGNEIDTMVKGVLPMTVPGVIATGSIGKRRFSF